MTQQFLEDGKLHFNVVAPMAGADGYGYSIEELVTHAVQQNAEIGFIAHDWQDRRYTSEKLTALETPREFLDTKEVLLVYFLPYAFHHFQSEFNIGMTMFETTEIPDTWARFCQIPRGLIVPSQFCKEVFQKKLPNQMIEVAPLGVNTSTYYYVEREESSVFTFLMAGLLHYRKGVEFAVRAFQEEFGRDADVRLILKTRRGFFDSGNEAIRDPRITVIDGDYHRADMLNLYHAGDCFIACSRGEASGLTPREAMATGLPAIVTDWGGLREIADERYTYPLRVDREESAPPVCSSYEQGITCGEPIGNFSRPSVEHLRELMRYAYEHPKENKEKGLQAALWMQREWNYTACSANWLKAIKRIYDEQSSRTGTIRPKQRAFS